LIKFNRALDKLKELKKEIEEVFKARENLSVKRLLHPDENSDTSTYDRFNVHVGFTISSRVVIGQFSLGATASGICECCDWLIRPNNGCGCGGDYHITDGNTVLIFLLTFFHFTGLHVARFLLIVVSNAIQTTVRRSGIGTGSCTLSDAFSTSHAALGPFSKVAPSSINYNKHKT